MAKLTKAILNKKVHNALLDMGHIEIFDSGWNLYGKYLGDGWYLILNLTIHRFYDDQFTTDINLSKHAGQNDFAYDAPMACFSRLEDYLKPRRDQWWQGLEEDSLNDFLSTLKEVEPIIINSKQALAPIVENSERVSTIVKVNKGVFEKYVDLFGSPSHSYNHFNLRKPIRTPDEWFIAAKQYFNDKESFIGDLAYSCETHAKTAFREWFLREYALRNQTLQKP